MIFSQWDKIQQDGTNMGGVFERQRLFENGILNEEQLFFENGVINEAQ